MVAEVNFCAVVPTHIWLLRMICCCGTCMVDEIDMVAVVPIE
jgi:hypothetical protein